MLGPRGEHPVGLVRPLRHQIVDQHPDIGLGTSQHDRLGAPELLHGVDPGHETLCGRFLVARRAVDLPRKEQPLDVLRLQTVANLIGRKVIVLDGIARPQHVHALQAGNLPKGGHLHLLGKTRRKAVHIDLVGVPALRLQKDGMAVPLREALDLVFNGRAVARSPAFDPAREHGTAVEAGAQNGMHLGRRVGEPAAELAVRKPIRHVGKRERLRIARLLLQPAVVDRAAVDARRRSRLEPSALKAQPLQTGRQPGGRPLAHTAAAELALAHVNDAVQEGAVRQDHTRRIVRLAELRAHPLHATVFDEHLGDRVGPHPQVRDRLQLAPHGLRVTLAVALGARPPDGRPLAPVEHPELNARLIGHAAHDPAQRIDLPHQVPLADSPDGRVARHAADRLQAHRDQQRAGSHPRRGRGRLGPGMAAPHHDHIVPLVRKNLHRAFFQFVTGDRA